MYGSPDGKNPLQPGHNLRVRELCLSLNGLQLELLVLGFMNSIVNIVLQVVAVEVHKRLQKPNMSSILLSLRPSNS